MMHAEGSFILPDNVPANEFLNLEGDKISTSRNWAVWLHEYLEDFPGKEDVLRYVLCANAPETKDNDFTWKDFQTRNNSELVAILGNFVNRTLVLTQNYYEGIVPERVVMNETDKDAITEIGVIKRSIEDNLEDFKFREALKDLMNLARLGNKYLADQEPWKIYKTDPERVKTILNISLQITAALSVLSEPFLPFTSVKLRTMINLSAETRWGSFGVPYNIESASIRNQDHQEYFIDTILLKEGHKIGIPELLFEKIEDNEIEKQVKKLEDKRNNNEVKNMNVNPQKPNISIDEFSKMDIRTGTVLTAEKVAKTKKLMKLTIDTGMDIRTVVSGIAEYYEPEQAVGKQVSILVNLEPRELKGIMSQGMILMAQDADGRLSFVGPADKVQNGGEIK
jgi:methionyl-tRNA synthetase